MSDSKYRIAIVGTGGIASAHAHAVKSLPDHAELVAGVDVDLDRAKEFATKWDIPAVYPSLTELLATGEVDLVHLCTPPSSHVPLAKECLAAEVDVLVEKPPTLSLDELDELLEAESNSSAQVICVFQHRFGSGAVRLRQLVADGILGRPLVALCNTTWYRDDAYFAVPWRGTFEVEGGGPLAGIDADMTAMPDAAMTLAVAALFAQGPTTVRGIGNWRVKETDRMAAVAAELGKLGARTEIGSDSLTVHPPASIRSASIATYNDHRMAMAFSLAACGGQPVVIENPACVAKTFPEYFEELAHLTVPAA